MPSLNYSSLFRAVIGSRLHDCEFVVFFDCPTGEPPARHVEDMVAAVWDVDKRDLDIYNVYSERELIAQAIAGTNAGDLRLFEVGAYQGLPIYADPSRTLMLVRPPTQMRLTAAQILLPTPVTEAKQA